MARTVAQIKAVLDNLFPPEWSVDAIGNAIVTGVATVLANRETAFDESGGWLEQMFRQTATGFWLDEHGDMFGVERDPGEPDTDYQERLLYEERILTEGNVVERFNRFLPGDGNTVHTEEPYYNVLDNSFFLGEYSSILTDPRREGEPEFLFWVWIPTPAVEYVDEAFLDVDCYLDTNSYIDEKQAWSRRRHILNILDHGHERRGYGIGYGATLEDPPPLYGSSVETYDDAVASAASGDLAEGEPVYVSSEEKWYIVRDGTPIAVSYDTVDDFQAEIDLGKIPDNGYSWIEEGGGGFYINTDGDGDGGGGTAVPVDKIPVNEVCQGTSDADYDYTLIIPRAIYFSSPSDGEVDADQLVSIGDI